MFIHVFDEKLSGESSLILSFNFSIEMNKNSKTIAVLFTFFTCVWEYLKIIEIFPFSVKTKMKKIISFWNSKENFKITSNLKQS